MQEGALALYKGWLPSVIGVVPYAGLNFGVYETLKALTLEHYGALAVSHVSHRLAPFGRCWHTFELIIVTMPTQPYSATCAHATRVHAQGYEMSVT